MAGRLTDVVPTIDWLTDWLCIYLSDNPDQIRYARRLEMEPDGCWSDANRNGKKEVKGIWQVTQTKRGDWRWTVGGLTDVTERASGLKKEKKKKEVKEWYSNGVLLS